MKFDNYYDRSMKSSDNRYRRVFEKMGYGTRSVRADDEVATLRHEYQALVGKKPYMGWDADTLRDKIEAHHVEKD